MSQIKVQAGPITIGAQLVSTVVLGPIKVDEGQCDVVLVTKTGGSGTTTPTAYKLQACPEDGSSVFYDVTSGTITASTSANAVVSTTCNGVIGKYIQVVSGAAFAAGTAQLYLLGAEKRF